MTAFNVRLGLACAALVSLIASVAEPQELVGQRVKVKGSWTGVRFRVHRVKLKEPRSDPSRTRVVGPVDSVEAWRHRLSVGPVRVDWDESTRLGDLRIRDLHRGKIVRIDASAVEHGAWHARSIEPEPEPPKSYEVDGQVTHQERLADGSMRLIVAGVDVDVPAGVYVSPSDLTRHPDDRRPADQLTLSLFGRPLVIGGEISTKSRLDDNFELGPSELDDIRLGQKLELEAFYPFSPAASLFFETRLAYLARRDRPDLEWDLERGEMWLYLSDLGETGLSLQLGRQRFTESREWWWDRDLDAVRVRFDAARVHAGLALAKELAPRSLLGGPIEPEEQGVVRVLGNASWLWAERQRLDTFLLLHDDRSAGEPLAPEDPVDAELRWLGARFSGELGLAAAGETDYRIDFAHVSGRERVHDASAFEERAVDGWAIDSGLTWQTFIPGRPRLSVGYAVGSGDPDPTSGVDRAFRQTGLHDNNGRFRGVDRFRFYGELLQPELSNLRVQQLALGFPLFRWSSVELVYHRYRQVVAAPFLRRSRLEIAPDGRDKAIGDEWDLVLGIEEWDLVELELVGATFRAGAAYGDHEGDRTYLVTAKLDLNF